jgi:hypothetical protein
VVFTQQLSTKELSRFNISLDLKELTDLKRSPIGRIGCGLAQRLHPLGDLVEVQIKLLCQLRQRLVFSQRRQRDFRFEHR